MSATTTFTALDHELGGSDNLSQSVSSVGSPRRKSKFSKPFKQASQFFLTRRFSDALVSIDTLVAPSSPGSNETPEAGNDRAAPVASADLKWRVKIWNFYITLQNAILELGPDDGKNAVGLRAWNAAVQKAKTGDIWDQVVNVGYRGDETLVDAEVVLNLANFLLAQSPDQKRNQTFLEIYLSAGQGVDDNVLDQPEYNETGEMKHNSERRVLSRSNTLYALEIQLQIIEVFALHVLPQNEEWDYAREVLNRNATLDEERRDLLLQALAELESVAPKDDDSEPDVVVTSNEVHAGAYPSIPRRLDRTASEVTVVPITKVDRSYQPEKVTEDEETIASSVEQGLRSMSPRPLETNSQNPAHSQEKGKDKRPVSLNQDNAKHIGIRRQNFALYDFVAQLIANSTTRLARNPTPLLQFVLFLTVLIGAMRQPGLKAKLRQMMDRILRSIKQTLGMGFRASSI